MSEREPRNSWSLDSLSGTAAINAAIVAILLSGAVLRNAYERWGRTSEHIHDTRTNLCFRIDPNLLQPNLVRTHCDNGNELLSPEAAAFFKGMQYDHHGNICTVIGFDAGIKVSTDVPCTQQVLHQVGQDRVNALNQRH
jgi:hypothetical protein